MSYFKQFPWTIYRFGNEDTFSRIQNLSAYVDIIDDIKDDVNFYREYSIIDGDRPDNVAQRLYNNPELHWTLFLLNDHIRSQGWPLSDAEVRSKAQTEYPNQVLTTAEDISSKLLVGQTAFGAVSGSSGTILRRRLDFGQIVVQSDDPFVDGETLFTNIDGVISSVVTYRTSPEYDAIHNYIDSTGAYVDVNPFDSQGGALFTPITYTDRLLNQNNELRNIRVIKPQSINTVVAAFNDAMRS